MSESARSSRPPEQNLKTNMERSSLVADSKASNDSNDNAQVDVAGNKTGSPISNFDPDRHSYALIKTSDNVAVSNITHILNTPNSATLPNIAKTCFKKSINNNTNHSQSFTKRSGTSGVSGQLYETKLLSLILFRTLRDDKINAFQLGTNIEGVGAFDDIVLKYETSDSQKHKMIFLQAKHKDDPNKDKLSVDDILKQSGDFSLLKYFESYLKIKQKFGSSENNAICSTKDVSYELIIYTSTKEQFIRKKILEDSDKEELIKTTEYGKAFQFAYDTQDVELLISTIAKYRATQLAKNLSKFIIKGNFSNIMSDDLMKIYHVYLAHKVIIIQQDMTTEEKGYCIGKFRESFWTSHDNNLSLMRHVICKEIAQTKEITDIINQQKEVEKSLKSLTFKLPINFGNHLFLFHGSEKKKQKQLENLCSIFHKLIPTGFGKHAKYIFVKLDDNLVGPDKIVQSKDLKTCRLAGLVGNLLIHDSETETLKFNLDEQNLSNDNIALLQLIKEKYDITLIRLDINIQSFPKLTLNTTEYDRRLVKDFFNILKFYTNQAKEDEVESILKQEIDKYFNNEQKQLDSLLRVKCDAIFLKVHDKIQKWWQMRHSAPYLTKACEFYQQAAREIIDSPLLNIIHFIYSVKNKNTLVEFEWEAIDALSLDCFLKSENKILIIVSDEISLSSKKLIQYFNKTEMANDYLFLDFDFMVIENYLELVNLEIGNSTVPVIVIIRRDCIDTNNQIVNNIINVFKGKIIIISHRSHKVYFINMFSENNIREDTKNNFNSLSNKFRRVIFEQRQVIFQGCKVNVHSVFDYKSLNMLSPKLLYKLIHKEDLAIGQSLLNTSYKDTINYYVNQNLYRYIVLLVLFRHGKQNSERKFFLSKGNHDIILFTESSKTFEETCKINENKNVHWFINNNKYNKIWKQSYGSLETLIEHVATPPDPHQDFILQINTLKDIQEKVIIINAEPGMGKSTLLTHIAINSKRLYPYIWILKISLLDNIDQFFEWRESKINITLLDVMIFLYKITIKDYKNNIDNEIISKLLRVSNNNEIYLNDVDNQREYFSGIDLSEIKLVNYFYNNNNLAVLFDGFDEICPDFANQVIQMLCLLKTSKLAHLWVTTRKYNVLRPLELALNTFSYTLNPLTQQEQKLFMQHFWTYNLSSNKQLNTIYSVYVEQFYSTLTTVLTVLDGGFLRVPLHLYMVAEVYQSYFKDFCDNPSNRSEKLKFKEIMKEIRATNLIKLYEIFTNNKFYKIRFGEKKQSVNFKDPDMRKMVDKERKVFMKNHKKIAAYSCLDQRIVFTEHDYSEDMNEFIKSVISGEEKTGIIEYVLHNSASFVHMSFAEYFAVEFLFDKLNSVNCTSAVWKYLVNDILISERYGLRRFINSKLQYDQNIVTNLTSNEDHLNVVFNALLAQDVLNGNAIHCAIQEDLEYITLFLLQSVKPLINKGNVHLLVKLIKTEILCPFCFAIIKQKPSIVKCIIELFTDIDCKLKDLFYTHRFITFEHILVDDACPEIFQCVLSAWSQFDSDLMVELFLAPYEDSMSTKKWAVVHQLVLRVKTFEKCVLYFFKLRKEDRVKIFSARDSEGQLPAHYAAKENNFKFFAVMEELLGRHELKNMCMSPDNYGFTPICRFQHQEDSHNPYRQEYQKLLNSINSIDDINIKNAH